MSTSPLAPPDAATTSDPVSARWAHRHRASGRGCFERYARLMDSLRRAQGAPTLAASVSRPEAPAAMIRHWGESAVETHAEVISAAVDLCNVARVADMETLQRWHQLGDAYARSGQRGVALCLMSGLAPDADACALLGPDDADVDNAADNAPEQHQHPPARQNGRIPPACDDAAEAGLSRVARKNRRRRQNRKARALLESQTPTPTPTPLRTPDRPRTPLRGPSPSAQRRRPPSRSVSATQAGGAAGEAAGEATKAGAGAGARRSPDRTVALTRLVAEREAAREAERDRRPLWSIARVEWAYLGGCWASSALECAALAGQVTGMSEAAFEAFAAVVDAAFAGCASPASASRLVTPGRIEAGKGTRLAAPRVDLEFATRDGARFALHRKLATRKDTWKLNTSTLVAREWPSASDPPPAGADTASAVDAALKRLGVASPTTRDGDALAAMDHDRLVALFEDRAASAVRDSRDALDPAPSADEVARSYATALLDRATSDLDQLCPGARLCAMPATGDGFGDGDGVVVFVAGPRTETGAAAAHRAVPLRNLGGAEAAACALVMRVALADMRVPPYDTALVATRDLGPLVDPGTLVTYLQATIEREPSRAVVAVGLDAETDARVGRAVGTVAADGTEQNQDRFVVRA